MELLSCGHGRNGHVWRAAGVEGRRGVGTVSAPGAASTKAAEPQAPRAARPASGAEREVEPGLPAEVPGQSEAGDRRKGVRGVRNTGCEATERQGRGPRGKRRNRIAAEVQGPGRYRADSIFPPPPPPPAGAAAEAAGGGARAAEFANWRRARRGLCSCGSRRRSPDLVFPERGESRNQRGEERSRARSSLSSRSRIPPRVAGVWEVSLSVSPGACTFPGRKLLPIAMISRHGCKKSLSDSD